MLRSPFLTSNLRFGTKSLAPKLLRFRTKFTTYSNQIFSLAYHVSGKNTISHHKVTISHQISRTKLLRFRTKKLRFRTKSPKQNYYDFAPNSLRFRTKFITISHQILTQNSYDFAPNSLRFRTKFIKMSRRNTLLL